MKTVDKITVGRETAILKSGLTMELAEKLGRETEESRSLTLVS